MDDDAYLRVRLPDKGKNEQFAIADQLLGGSRLMVICEDDKKRLGRIRGKMKKRRWIKTGDLLIIQPWGLDDDKADVTWRYTRTEANYLSERRLLPKGVDLFRR
jgi:translation initiation factor 1A